MAKEIERKYLVDADLWKIATKPIGEHYRQGYLLTDPSKTIRVRLTPQQGFLTIKGSSSGATRDEFEYEIPTADAQELLDKFAVTELSKIRYKVPFAGQVWEVDEFLGENTGLMIAEIELSSEHESFACPPWVGAEVTGEEKYYNSKLTTTPFQSWEP